MPVLRLDHERLQRACARMGDVVVDPRLWSNLMDDICAAVSARGALLLQTDVRTSNIPRTDSMEDVVRHYFGNNWHLRDDRGTFGVPFFLRGETVILDQDFMSREGLRHSAFYNECLVPVDIPWFAGVKLHADTALWAVCIQRSARQGPFDPADKALLTILSSYLTEAATLSAKVGRVALTSAIDALGQIQQPALAVDRMGRVLDANPAAVAVFDDDFFVKDRRLHFSDKSAAKSFDELIQVMQFTPDTKSLACRDFTVRRAGGPPIVVEVLPVPPAARNPFLGARVILHLKTPWPQPARQATLVKAFGLTGAEARVAAAIGQGLAPEQIAQQFGISVETVRAHLKSIFAKTGARRQSELAALIARL